MSNSRSEYKNESQESDEEINSSMCPVTSQVFKDPVVSSRTGITLEREGARQWHEEFKHNTCPVTRKETAYKDYVPNITFKNFIEEANKKIKLQEQQLTEKIALFANENKQLQQELVQARQELEVAKQKITILKSSLVKQSEIVSDSLARRREEYTKLRALEEAAWQQMKQRFFTPNSRQEIKPAVKTISIPDCEFLFAVRKRDVSKAKTWLGIGANILAQDAKSGDTAMDIAKKNNDVAMMDMLVHYREKSMISPRHAP